MLNGWTLFGFRGRLNRKPYWIATIELMIAALIVASGVAIVFNVTGQAPTAQELLRVAHPWLTGFTLLLAYPAAAVFAKRLHDRNKTGWLAALLIVPMLVGTWLDPSGSVMQTPLIHSIYLAASTMTIIVGIWFLIELGFMRGTPGDNRYGRDPLAATPAG
jgi:uncharacterized membrane protein YhaH (DUF805 family)